MTLEQMEHAAIEKFVDQCLKGRLTAKMDEHKILDVIDGYIDKFINEKFKSRVEKKINEHFSWLLDRAVEEKKLGV